jgi:16S rRNA (guanine966-N2)-methyltransferase
MTALRRSSSTTSAGRRSAPAGRNRVRIIAGKWRSRQVRFPPAAQLRPTPDRVRETLFNWLGQRLDGLACLDLFAGSGALGFEAASRGATRVVLVENDRAVAQALRETARDLDAAGTEVIEAEAMAYLRRAGERFDVAFIDPPFASDLAARVLELLAPRLNAGARVYVESAAPIEAARPWRALREDRAGAVRYGLYEYAP